MIVQRAVPSRGFDTDTEITADAAAAFVAAGFRWCARYVSRAAPEQGDLTKEEVNTILAAGLALIVVQHAPPANWSASNSNGLLWGRAALRNVQLLGLPIGLSLFKDHEGVNLSAADATEIAGHINNWSQPLRQAGYSPGLYVGFDAGLDAAQLYYRLTLNCYWQSASQVPAPEVRGYCIHQINGAGGEIGGVTYDLDMLDADAKGDLPYWLVSDPTA